MMGKRLYRSRRDRMIGGVAGGLAEYFGVDPVIMRLIWLVLLFTGIGFFAYIAALIIIPEASDEEPFSGEPGHSHPGDAGTAKQLLGILLIALGVIFLVRNMIPSYIFIQVRRFFWPTLLIVCGVALIWNGTRKE
jgi:phage shock protein C